MYYMGFTYQEAYTLPLWQRTWFVERIKKELSRGAEDGSNNSRAAHDNDAQTRAMLGRYHPAAPAKLRRFT